MNAEVEVESEAGRLDESASKNTQTAATETKANEHDGNEARLPIVEARGLAGDTVFLEGCATVGHIMAKISLRRKRLATHVVVMDPSGRPMADDEEVLPLVQFVIINEGDAASANESARRNLRLYAEVGDDAACGQAVGILAGTGHSAHVLNDVVAAKEASWRTAAKTLVRLGVGGDLALHKAVDTRDSEGVKVLLSIDPAAHVDGYPGNSTTALISAASNGYPEIVETLLSAGSSVDRQDLNGCTALIRAATNGYPEILETLLSAGSTVDRQDLNGRTALIRAAQKGRLEVVEMLLAAGSAVDHEDKFGRTALVAAAENGHLEVLNTLLPAGAAVDHQDKCGRTALISAAQHGRLEVTNMLLSAGSTVDHEDKFGFTALGWAAKKGRVATMNVLQQASAAKSH